MPAKNKKAAEPTSSRSASARAVAASKPPSRKRKMAGAEKKYYAVRFGKVPGVYTDWTECQGQISGFKGAIFKSFPSEEDAWAFVEGRELPSTSIPEPPRYYGVAIGRKPGVYTDWAKVQQAIVGWKGPKYKRFDTREDAEAYVRTYASANSPAIKDESNDEAEAYIGRFSVVDSTADEQDTSYGADEWPPAKKTKKAADTASPLTIYTDGSSRGNGKLGAAAGVGVFFGPNDSRNISERLKGELQTNQRAELTAILRALEVAPEDKDAEIMSDSKYSIQCATEWYKGWERNGWKSTSGGDVKNQDLVMAIRAKIDARERRGTRTTFIWVKGHSTNKGNIAADNLATNGALLPLPS